MTFHTFWCNYCTKMCEKSKSTTFLYYKYTLCNKLYFSVYCTRMWRKKISALAANSGMPSLPWRQCWRTDVGEHGVSIELILPKETAAGLGSIASNGIVISVPRFKESSSFSALQFSCDLCSRRTRVKIIIPSVRNSGELP